MPTKSPKNESKIERPPVIAIMGHIDHGKSKLLDYIRQTNIVDSESGGITQHTSAYEVIHKNKDGIDKKITFLDTPGHAAFETMRERGAVICDIAILIVSAEEGVKAQTLEALRSIQSASKPFIIAFSKIDKTNADIERTKQSLAENSILVEGYGGSIPWVAISSKTGEGVPELLDLMLLVAEMEELKGEANEPGSGYVLEAGLDPKVGITSTIIIKNGKIKVNDFIVVGGISTKIKRMENFLGKNVTEMTFSSPVKIYGFAKVPEIGAEFTSTDDKKTADCLTEKFLQEIVGDKMCAKLEASCLNQISIPLIIKSDTAGTKQAVEKEIGLLKHERVNFKIIKSEIGAITENDVKSLTNSSEGGLIVGFRVKAEKSALDVAEKFGVAIQTDDIIYKLSEWLQEEMSKRAPKITTEETVGRAKILKTFNRNKDKQVVGGSVLTGKISRSDQFKIMRRETEIGRGRISGLQQQKIKAQTVEEGIQFGAEVESKFEIMPSDILEVFELVTK
ncbi:MAG: translation initiation factor IF-2 [Candidatus Paceibacterota bacterium]|jgi:translation initiation factor IF-2